MNPNILEQLIMEGDSLTSTIHFVPVPAGTSRNYSVYSTSKQEQYQIWRSSAQRFIKSFYPADLNKVKEAAKKLSPENHKKILDVLQSIKISPDKPAEKTEENAAITNNSHIANHNNNTRHATLNFFLEVLKDELTGKDLKAIKSILQNYDKEPEETKSELIKKITGLGVDVLSNIIVGILINPGIYKRLS